MQIAHTNQRSILKREFHASGWPNAAVIPSSQERYCGDAHHPRLNGALSFVFQCSAFSAAARRNRNRHARNFTTSADAVKAEGLLASFE
jgi:hypothetical protein